MGSFIYDKRAFEYTREVNKTIEITKSVLGERLIWWLFAGTRGGPMRTNIVLLLKQEPLNANQISGRLGIDYKTARHHLDILVKNKVLTFEGDRYGRMFFLSDAMDESYPIFRKVCGEVKSDNPDQGEGVG